MKNILLACIVILGVACSEDDPTPSGDPKYSNDHFAVTVVKDGVVIVECTGRTANLQGYMAHYKDEYDNQAVQNRNYSTDGQASARISLPTGSNEIYVNFWDIKGNEHTIFIE